jgi:DNA-binding transcriptional MerR regulator
LTYTVADLIKATETNPRTIKFWVDHGLIRATKASEGGGHGVHRQFTRNELILACLLLPLSIGWRGDQTRTLSELKAIAEQLRLVIAVEKECIEKAIEGRKPYYLVLTWIFGGEINSWVTPTHHVKEMYFPGVIGDLEERPGRAEVLYLNQWLRPVRNM